MAMRLVQINLGIACGIFALGLTTNAAAASIPLALRQTTKCMLNVLKTTPGIETPKLGISTGQGWKHPFVEYRFTDKIGGKNTVRFDAQRTFESGHYSYWYVAVLPGLATPGSLRLPDWGTSRLSLVWKTRCHVEATVLRV